MMPNPLGDARPTASAATRGAPWSVWVGKFRRLFATWAFGFITPPETRRLRPAFIGAGVPYTLLHLLG